MEHKGHINNHFMRTKVEKPKILNESLKKQLAHQNYQLNYQIL